jgi:UDP-N-acetylmuramoyl-L-alanyl-D-glutamate--2,6-diaminopimelate ligase
MDNAVSTSLFSLQDLLQFLGQEAPELNARLIHSGATAAPLRSFAHVTSDSRKVDSQALFVALPGSRTDGHQFIPQALQANPVAILVQAGRYRATGEETAALVEVQNTSRAYALACAFLAGVPARRLNCIGVTGTNGKTTVTHLIEQILIRHGQQVGLIGTLGVRQATKNAGQFSDTGHTTPMAETLQAHLKAFAEAGTQHVVMEVSSHALEQYRTATCDFTVGVITNLTQDHLDYHVTMENYAQAKALLFSNMAQGAPPETKTAVINVDDEWAETFLKACPQGVRVLRYGIHALAADVRAVDVAFTIAGATFTLHTPQGQYAVNMRLAGEFSVYNALAAISAAMALSVPMDTILDALQEQAGVPGRFEVVHQRPSVIVDYAHTPDGLENVLQAARAVLPEAGQLITLFGCGGDRDATKRPKMAAIAERLSDKVVVTSDNPRTENPEHIISDILTGLQNVSPEKVKVLPDRRSAIHAAIDWAGPEDIVVLAGKGHETYQILGKDVIHFDDKEEALTYLQQASAS